MKKKIKLRIIPGSLFTLIMYFFMSDLHGQTGSDRTLPQFLFPDFTKSIIKMKDGRTLTAVLDYNMVDEEMVFEQKKVYMVLDKPLEIDTVYLHNRLFIPVEKAFYEVIVKGNVPLYIQHKARYVPVSSSTAYGMKSPTLGPTSVLTVRSGNQMRSVDLPENVTISLATVYWVKIGNEMHKFATEKQFLKLFPEKEGELKEFIKKSRLDIKTREDLIKLGNFCNGLIK
jgi:hypothetical protein